MTILSSGTPAYELISMTLVEGHDPPDLYTNVCIGQHHVDNVTERKTHIAVTVHPIALVVELDV
jgi:hypothetical protein